MTGAALHGRMPAAAALAVGVLAAALATGPAGAAAPAASPASPSASVAPSAAPSAAVPAMSDAAAELLLHVPGAIRGTCAEQPFNGQDVKQRTGELARVRCAPDDATFVTYAGFDTALAMDTAFDDLHAVALAMGFDPSPDDCAAGAFSGTWTQDGVTAGRLDCQVLLGSATLAWTTADARILSAISTTDDPGTAWRLWLAAGPDVIPAVAPAGGATPTMAATPGRAATTSAP